MPPRRQLQQVETQFPAGARRSTRAISTGRSRNVCGGWNTNIVAWGVHSTHKFRLLFGKSTGSNTFLPGSGQLSSSPSADTEREVLEIYGQLGALLYEFFHVTSPRRMSSTIRSQQPSLSSSGWRLGISGWIIVDNQVIDLLKPAVSPSASSRKAGQLPSSSGQQPAPLSFVSLEAKSFASACKILQIAKTNRIVMNQHAEHAHFFLRLAFFHNGQVSTMHFVDLIDLKDFKDDGVSISEKQELLEIFHEIRQPAASPRYHGVMVSPQTKPGSNGAVNPSLHKTRNMVLSNFMLLLLTANAKTFLYANVIDSRTSLRESVQLLNAVANVKGFTCACKRLCGIEFIQLGFQNPPDDICLQEKSNEASKQKGEATRDDDAAMTKALAAVAVGESLLSRLASSADTTALGSSLMSLSSSFTSNVPFPAPNLSSILSSSSPPYSPLNAPLVPSPSTVTAPHTARNPQSQRKVSFSDVPMESETLSWLESFSQRKRDILGGTIDTIRPLAPPRQQQNAVSPLPLLPQNDVSSDEEFNLAVCRNDSFTSTKSPSANAATVGITAETLSSANMKQHENSSTEVQIAQTSVDPLERLRGATSTMSDEKLEFYQRSTKPLPISDDGTMELTTDREQFATFTADTRHHDAVYDQNQLRYEDRGSYTGRAASYPQISNAQFQSPMDDSAQVSSGAFNSTRSSSVNMEYPCRIQDDNALDTSANRNQMPFPVRSSPEESGSDAAAARLKQSVGEVSASLSSPDTSRAFPSKSGSFVQPPSSSISSPAFQHAPSSSPVPPLRGQQPYVEALEKAHIPSRVMPPPNVDGLDAATATKIQATDTALLRKNYDTLLTIVQEQQRLREAAEAKAAEAVHDLEEVRASFEVQLENLKLANVALRSKVRSLEKQSALPRVFEQYEQELQSLLKEVQQLRDRNVALELKMTESDGCSGPGSVHDLKKRYQTTMDEKQQLEKQLLEYRKKERELTNKEALMATKLGKLRLNAEMNQAQEEAELLHQENEKLLVEKAAATEELLATKMYLASIENEQRKADIHDKFVKKHGDRMSRLKSKADSSSSSRNGSESWRRDAAARECEDKVFATVKRSIPQLVPLVNKMLRRLEMQELALREYSDREIDFIHLLVELVSDQSAVSLKNMIHAEMQKLS
ncbi:hypothetical protein FI667_g1604, partial [Globisporangium splendens]